MLSKHIMIVLKDWLVAIYLISMIVTKVVLADLLTGAGVVCVVRSLKQENKRASVVAGKQNYKQTELGVSYWGTPWLNYFD